MPVLLLSLKDRRNPGVTGVLLVALENATKAMPVFMGLDKEYVGVMHLHKQIDENILLDTIRKKFIGKIVQVPPVKAAVARKPREKQIYFFDILEIEGKDALFKIGCEAGVYVRKLIDDLGKALGIGAHLTELRRTRVGKFTEDKATPLLKIKDVYEFWKEGEEGPLRKILIPVEYAVDVKKIFVKDSAIASICKGAPIYVKGITRLEDGIVKGETVAIYSLKEELIALGIAKMTSKEIYEKNKGIAVRTDRVFMEKGTYPG